MSGEVPDHGEFERQLRDSLADGRFDDDERASLRAIGNRLDGDGRRALRNRAFALAGEEVVRAPERAPDLLRWLERLVRTLDATEPAVRIESSACFSPGDACLRKLRGLCRGARRSIDICVYTIADDRLSSEILDCFRRGVALRLISDDGKKTDHGSDVNALRAQGVPVRFDDSPYHMHHKFALFDGHVLANGSFNWTRSASVHNEENLVVSNDPGLVRSFAAQFQAMWDSFAHTA